MKNQIDFVYDLDGCVRHDGWRLWPWPNFRMEVVASSQGTSTEVLRAVMEADDPFCLLWKGQIPEDVIGELSRFPTLSPKALMVAQLNPSRLIQLCQEMPFVAMLLWSLSDKTEQAFGLEEGAISILDAAGLPSDRETIEIVRKVKASTCQHEIIPAVRKALDCPLRRRLLKCADAIDEEICSLLKLPIRDRRVQDAIAAVIRKEARDGAL